MIYEISYYIVAGYGVTGVIYYYCWLCCMKYFCYVVGVDVMEIIAYVATVVNV